MAPARQPGNPPAPRRILIKCVNWLGDLVMSLPAMRAVRRAYPDAHLALLVRRELASFFDGSAWVDEVLPHAAPGSVRARLEAVRAVRAGGFDLAIVLPNSFEAAFWVWAARVPERVGVRGRGRTWMLTRHAPSARGAGHEVHYRLALLRETLGIAGDATDFRPDVSPRHRARMEHWLSSRLPAAPGPVVALAPGAAYGPAKEWPARHYAALIDLLAQRHGAAAVLVGAPSERGRCEEVAAASRAGALVAAGETTVGELVALLSLCAAFAGNDSGAMHVAGALGLPTVGIFGSTSPERTAPLGPRSRTIYLGIECSPCRRRTCPYGHYACLTAISPGAVCEALVEAGAFGSDAGKVAGIPSKRDAD